MNDQYVKAIDTLKWLRTYISGYCIISHPKITTTGITPEEQILNKIDEALNFKTPQTENSNSNEIK